MLKRLFAKTLPSPFNFQLPDGLAVQVAVVSPAHAPRFVLGYEKLSEQSRRMRFFGQVSGLSSKQLAFLTKPDGRNHIAYAALDLSMPEEPGAGVARCIRLDGDSKIAEVAITILDAYQARGVGLLLHACLHVAAHAVGVQQFIYDVSAENDRFIHHLQALGARQVSRDRDVVRLMLPVCGSASKVKGEAAAARRFAEMLSSVAAAKPAVSVI